MGILLASVYPYQDDQMKKFRFLFFIPFLLASICTSICLAQFENNNLANESAINSQKTREEVIEAIRKRLQSVEGKMKSFEKKDSPITKNKLSEKNLASSNFTYNYSEPQSSSDLSAADENKVGGSNVPDWSENSTGMYFLPFFGLSFSSDLEWTPPSNIQITIEQKNGFLSGFRLGYSWENLYLEQKTFYFSNNIAQVNPFISGENKGDISGISTMIIAGLNFHLSDYVEWNIGGGVGGTRQQLDIQYGGAPPKTESGHVFTYQFSTGIEFRPVEHFILGIHYNWYYTKEFSDFSSRHLNSFELSLGYFD
jgi:opacity protein-like surface antigen